MGLFSRKPRENAGSEWVPGDVEPDSAERHNWHVPFTNPGLPGAVIVLTFHVGSYARSEWPCLLTATFLNCEDGYPYDMATWSADREFFIDSRYHLDQAASLVEYLAQQFATQGTAAVSLLDVYFGAVFGWNGQPFETAED